MHDMIVVKFHTGFISELVGGGLVLELELLDVFEARGKGVHHNLGSRWMIRLCEVHRLLG